MVIHSAIAPSAREDSFADRVDAAVAWMASFGLHLGVAIVVFFVLYAANRLRVEDASGAEPIVIPSSFDLPAVPGGVPNSGAGEDPLRDARQNLEKTADADGWSHHTAASDVTEYLQKATAGTAFTGVRPAVNIVGASGSLSVFGSPSGGQGAGPTCVFYGDGGNAYRIVFVIDHSGSMVEKMDLVKEQVKKSVRGLSPVQLFNVISFSEQATLVGPAGMVRATAANKQAVCDRIDPIRAEGNNDDVLAPFARAFTKAFALKPQVIFFLTDGAFDPQLVPVVERLNADHRVKINTIAYNTGAGGEDSKFAQQLKQLARENGGHYNYVSE